jgi:hypothetical protein
MKEILLFTCLIFTFSGMRYSRCNNYFKFNTCEFKNIKKNAVEINGLLIVKYTIVNNPNENKDTLGEYFLIKNLSDTFNLVEISTGGSNDSTIKKFRRSDNWSFDPMLDTCIGFYSQIILRKAINPKYPLLFGRIYMKLD